MTIQDQSFITKILSNSKQVHTLLLSAYSQGEFTVYIGKNEIVVCYELSEYCAGNTAHLSCEQVSGGYNFLHVLSSCFLPPVVTPHPSQQRSSGSGRHTSREGIRDLMRRANYLAAMGLVGSSAVAATSASQDSDDDVRFHDSVAVGEQLASMIHEDCKEHKVCQDMVTTLMQQR